MLEVKEKVLPVLKHCLKFTKSIIPSIIISNIRCLPFTSDGISHSIQEKYMRTIEFISYWRNAVASSSLFNWKLETADISYGDSCIASAFVPRVNIFVPKLYQIWYSDMNN